MMIIKILKKDNNNNNKSNIYKASLSAGLKAQMSAITNSILPSCDCDLFVTILIDPDASASLSVLEHSLKTKEDCVYADLCICPICDNLTWEIHGKDLIRQSKGNNLGERKSLHLWLVLSPDKYSGGMNKWSKS